MNDFEDLSNITHVVKDDFSESSLLDIINSLNVFHFSS